MHKVFKLNHIYSNQNVQMNPNLILSKISIGVILHVYPFSISLYLKRYDYNLSCVTAALILLRLQTIAKHCIRLYLNPFARKVCTIAVALIL